MASGDHMNGNGSTKRTMPSLPPELQGHIGQKLQDSYSDLVSAPVPDRFTELLRQLKNQEAQSKGD
jgi:hypothetical protein